MSDAVRLQLASLPDRLCNKPSDRLEHWSLRVSPFLDDGAIVPAGRVFDHPKFANGAQIVTSSLPLIVRTETADLA